MITTVWKSWTERYNHPRMPRSTGRAALPYWVFCYLPNTFSIIDVPQYGALNKKAPTVIPFWGLG